MLPFQRSPINRLFIKECLLNANTHPSHMMSASANIPHADQISLPLHGNLMCSYTGNVKNRVFLHGSLMGFYTGNVKISLPLHGSVMWFHTGNVKNRLPLQGSLMWFYTGNVKVRMSLHGGLMGFHTDCVQASGESEVFIPEMVENLLEDGSTPTYRFQCPHAGVFQCKITNLVFEMEDKGEVLYRIVSWDTRLMDGLGHMQPAGPLYKIDCFEGSVSHLHLPHCETSYDNQVELAVAHFTDDNIEILKPLKVTDTHVIIRVQGLSLFGPLINLIFYSRPISAQVLLFYKEMNGQKIRNKLLIHLLPENVPVEEVEKKLKSYTYFETSSTCELRPGRKYTASCDPYTPQPKVALFQRTYGPNYHPTFVVFCEDEDVTVSVLDEDGMEVWEPHQIFLTEQMDKTCQSAEATSLKMVPEVDFVDKHMDELIDRVNSVMEIADRLKRKGMITGGTYSDIQTTKTSQSQMRILDKALNAGGRTVKKEFYKILKEKEPYLVDDLESGPSNS
ncbi:NACHT, LRR and PYD domains-containing protein 1b allele 3-like isoform X2 [Brachyhypopomus gauderio]|uniref:NACHT, LRR and PYD domains-containing protein 1b allele 3-like isoform X2 n=1 Tax=Brachyhypopomus gauderio TaxID=698409 RepID=UPI004041487E